MTTSSSSVKDLNNGKEYQDLGSACILNEEENRKIFEEVKALKHEIFSQLRHSLKEKEEVSEKVGVLNKSCGNLNEDKKKLLEETKNLREELKTLIKKNSEYEKIISELNVVYNQMRKENEELSEEKKALVNELEITKTWKLELEKTFYGLRDSYDQIMNEKEDLLKMTNNLKKELKVSETMKAELNNKIKEKDSILFHSYEKTANDKSELMQIIEKLKEMMKDSEEKMTQYQEKIRELSDSYSQIKESNEVFQQEIRILTEDRDIRIQEAEEEVYESLLNETRSLKEALNASAVRETENAESLRIIKDSCNRIMGENKSLLIEIEILRGKLEMAEAKNAEEAQKTEGINAEIQEEKMRKLEELKENDRIVAGSNSLFEEMRKTIKNVMREVTEELKHSEKKKSQDTEETGILASCKQSVKENKKLLEESRKFRKSLSSLKEATEGAEKGEDALDRLLKAQKIDLGDWFVVKE